MSPRALPATAPLNVHAERSLLSPAQLGRWQGLPLVWVDAAPAVRTRNITRARPVLSLLEAGHARASFDSAGTCAELDLSAGAMGLFPAGIETRRSEWQCRDARRIMVDLDLSLLAQHGWVDEVLVGARFAQVLEFRDAELATLLRLMVQEVQAGCPHGALYAETLSLGVAMRITRRHDAAATTGAHQRERGRLSDAQMRRVDELIAQQLQGPLSLADLARAAGFSKPHFVRLFRHTTGRSPHAYVLQQRAEHARQLVQDGRLTLADVAAAAGFASQSHLNAVFTRHFGCTPGRLRREAAGRA